MDNQKERERIRKERMQRDLAEMKRRLHVSDQAESRAYRRGHEMPQAVVPYPTREQVEEEMKRRGMIKREDCDECYGTGFVHGIGGPCSKGCGRPATVEPREERVAIEVPMQALLAAGWTWEVPSMEDLGRDDPVKYRLLFQLFSRNRDS